MGKKSRVNPDYDKEAGRGRADSGILKELERMKFTRWRKRIRTTANARPGPVASRSKGQ